MLTVSSSSDLDSEPPDRPYIVLYSVKGQRVVYVFLARTAEGSQVLPLMLCVFLFSKGGLFIFIATRAFYGKILFGCAMGGRYSA